MKLKRIKKIPVFLIAVITFFSVFAQINIGNKQEKVVAAGLEKTDVAIKNFTIEHTNGASGDVFKIYEHFKLNIDWDASVYQNTIHQDDYFDIKLPDNMQIPNNPESIKFSILTPDGKEIAKAFVKAIPGGGGSVRVTFSALVENNSNVKGTISLAATFADTVVAGQKNSFEATINGTVSKISVPIDPKAKKDELIGKWGQATQNNDVVDWLVRINQKKGTFSNVVIKDQLSTTTGDLQGMHYIEGTFKLKEVVYNEYADVVSVISTTDVSDQIQFNADKTEFTYNMGKIDGKQYMLFYESTYVPGTTLKNSATFSSTEEQGGHSYAYRNASGYGVGYGDLLNKIQIIKVDSDNNTIKLKDAKFKVTKLSDNTTLELTTNDKGEILLDRVISGDYKIEEITAPSGYQLDPTPQTIHVEGGKTVTLTFKDKKSLGKLTLVKKDAATGGLLQGAVFEVKDSTKAVVDTITTDAKGVAISKDLPLGTYTVVEKTAPTGYVLNPTEHTVTITANGQVVAVGDVLNTKEVGKIELTKVDKENASKLAGAEFDIKDALGNVVDHITTDAKGVATSKNLPLGAYTLVETKAPKGYKLDSTPVSATIKKQGEIVKVERTNVLAVGKIVVSKFDKETRNRLSGMVFKLKKVDTGAETTIEMKENNVMEIINLSLGTYEIVEVKAPAGYELDSTVHTLVIEKDGDVKTLDIFDVRKPETPKPPVVPEKKIVKPLPKTGVETKATNTESNFLIILIGLATVLTLGLVVFVKRNKKTNA